MITASSPGSFQNTTKFLLFMQNVSFFNDLERYGREGVRILSAATPKETGETAESWEYTVTHQLGKHTISWYNTHVVNGVNIAVIIQYGHGTGTGGYVEGIDYINPALRPLFDKIADDIWRQVRNG